MSSDASSYIQSHQEIAHLMGHPLGSLISNPLTTSKDPSTTSSSSIDLFMLSLSNPILLFLFPSSSSTQPHLILSQESIQKFLKKEPELKIFGMSTETQEEQRKSFQNSKQGFFSLDLLSDYHLSFSNFLELPKFKDQNGESRLKRLTLLFRGGQITRIDYSKKEMVEEVGIEGRILEMLRDDSELA